MWLFLFSCLFCFLNEKKKLCWVCYTFKRYIDVYDTFYCEFCSSIKIHKKKMSAYSQKFHQWSFSYFVPIYYVYNIVVCKIRTIFNKYLLSIQFYILKFLIFLTSDTTTYIVLLILLHHINKHWRTHNFNIRSFSSCTNYAMHVYYFINH